MLEGVSPSTGVKERDRLANTCGLVHYKGSQGLADEGFSERHFVGIIPNPLDQWLCVMLSAAKPLEC